jgi:hypothetical protein
VSGQLNAAAALPQEKELIVSTGEEPFFTVRRLSERCFLPPRKSNLQFYGRRGFPWLAVVSPQRQRFDPGPIHVGLTVYKWTGEAFSAGNLVFPLSTIPPVLHDHSSFTGAI